MSKNYTKIDSQERWDRYFLDLCESISTKSKDKSTKCGCVIVNDRNSILSTGWNGFPRGICDEYLERHERPVKYLWTEHAERNAIYNAASEGIRLVGSTIYSTPGISCSDCARAIIQSGIKRTVFPKVDYDKIFTGDFHFDVSLKMFEEAQIQVDYIERT